MILTIMNNDGSHEKKIEYERMFFMIRKLFLKLENYDSFHISQIHD